MSVRNYNSVFFCVLALVTWGMSYGMQDIKNEQQTALMAYVKSDGNPRLLSYIKNIDLNAPLARSDITPLMYAIACLNTKAVSALLEQGADPCVRGLLGATAFAVIEGERIKYAHDKKILKACKKMMQNMLDVVKEEQLSGIYREAVEKDNVFLVEELFSRKVPWSTPAPLLVVAVKCFAENIVRFLCNQGVDPNSVDDQNMSCVKHAVLGVMHSIVNPSWRHMQPRAEAIVRCLCETQQVDCMSVAPYLGPGSCLPVPLKALVAATLEEQEKRKARAVSRRTKKERRRDHAAACVDVDPESIERERVQREAERRLHDILHASIIGLHAGGQAVQYERRIQQEERDRQEQELEKKGLVRERVVAEKKAYIEDALLAGAWQAVQKKEVCGYLEEMVADYGVWHADAIDGILAQSRMVNAVCARVMNGEGDDSQKYQFLDDIANVIQLWDECRAGLFAAARHGDIRYVHYLTALFREHEALQLQVLLMHTYKNRAFAIIDACNQRGDTPFMIAKKQGNNVFAGVFQAQCTEFLPQ